MSVHGVLFVTVTKVVLICDSSITVRQVTSLLLTQMSVSSLFQFTPGFFLLTFRFRLLLGPITWLSLSLFVQSPEKPLHGLTGHHPEWATYQLVSLGQMPILGAVTSNQRYESKYLAAWTWASFLRQGEWGRTPSQRSCGYVGSYREGGLRKALWRKGYITIFIDTLASFFSAKMAEVLLTYFKANPLTSAHPPHLIETLLLGLFFFFSLEFLIGSKSGTEWRWRTIFKQSTTPQAKRFPRAHL